MAYFEFDGPYAFNAGSASSSDNVMVALQNTANYSVYYNDTDGWVAQLNTPIQGVAYVAFVPATSFAPASTSSELPPAGVVYSVVWLDADANVVGGVLDLDPLGLSAATMIATPSLMASGDDEFYAFDGAATFYAGAGADLLSGDVFNDVLHGETGDDLVFGYAGNDNAFGEDGDDILLGEDGADTLSGAAGADTMDGGAGNDSIDGGAGDDLVSYAFFDTSVTVSLALQGAQQDTGGGGFDTLVNIEQLEGSSVGDALTGDATANTLYGFTGNDTLNGAAGADTMQGDMGDDLYYVDDANDVLIESVGQGFDIAIASVDYTIGANVENLVVLALNGTGNAGANAIAGNNLNNHLDGAGGADTLSGGLGDDFYTVDDSGDVVAETDTGGFDTVQSYIAYTLAPNVEFGLLLTGGASLTGNSLNNILTGNAGANTLDGGVGDDILIGGAGDDTYLVDAVGDNITENAGEGTDLVRASFSFTLSDNVENLTLLGVGDVNATGNALGNFLVGNSGMNTLYGVAGADTLQGGDGGDLYIIDDDLDQIVETAGGTGFDTVHAYISYTLADNVEILALAGDAAIDGTGNALNNILIGNNSANALYGLAGNDALDGVGGDDTMYGGTGNDSYVLNDAGDVAIENAGEGVDTIQVSWAYTLADTFENLTLLTNNDLNGTGNAADNTIFANNGANVLLGFDGADVLLGWGGGDSLVGGVGDDQIAGGVWFDTLEGGEGADILDGGADGDSMTGGAGDDFYYVDNGADTVAENAGEGTDTVSSTIGVFALMANVENLELDGSAINAYGNELDNRITANAANNFINGGLGADTMLGGDGNDTYLLDNAGDTVTETAGAGTDIIFSSVNVGALAQNVENLTISGAAALATGNSLDNIITGNSANNTLNGGAGEDMLAGGFGNDTYIVNSAGDVVTEAANAGFDTIISSIDMATLLANFENLTLTGNATTGGGNELANVIVGNALNNILTGGLGGDQLNGAGGADTMSGGLGDDSYLVENAGDVVNESSGEGFDTVYAFVSISDLVANVEKLTLMPAGGAINGWANDLDNRLNGNDSANDLRGAGGNDVINGLGGDDFVWGGAGLDNVWGGGGADIFAYYAVSDSGVTGATRDLINDYVQGEDHIYVAYDADSVNDGIQGFGVIGTAAFTHTPGEIRYDLIDAAGTANDFTLVSLDVNGDAMADSQFTLRGLVALTWADFTP